MSNSTHPENSITKPATPPQKKEAQADPLTPSAGATSTPAQAGSRCCAICFAPGVSITLAMFGIAKDLHTSGMLYGLAVGQQSAIRIRAADHASARELTRQVQHFTASKNSVIVLGPKTSTPPDYRSPEGRALISAVKSPECLIVAVPSASKKTRWSDLDLTAFKHAIETDGVLSIATFQGLNKDEELLMLTCFDAVFTVSQCEPDEDFASAYMAAPMVGSLLAATGHKPQIENIRMADGHIERQCQPCVSSDKLTREMYRMREEGRSMAEISDKLGFDKSTISRRLSALPYHLRRHCM